MSWNRGGTVVGVLFIAGAGRSGSTALGQYLEQELGWFHAGELRYLWTRGFDDNQLCECGAAFDGCPFWVSVVARAYGDEASAVREEVRRLAPRLDRMRHIPRHVVTDSSVLGDRRAFAEILNPLYAAIGQESGTDRVVDSSKDPSYLYLLRSVGAAELEVLHLVRDSRAVAYSWTRQKLRPEISTRTTFMKRRSPTRSAWLWSEYNAAVDLYRALYGGTRRIRYEDFVVCPVSVLEAAGIPEAAAARPKPEGHRHSFSGNPSRFATGPLRLTLDNAWKQQMPLSDQRRVTLISGMQLRRYGYPLKVGGKQGAA